MLLSHYTSQFKALISFDYYRIWLIGVSFVLFQFFLQLSSGVIVESIRNEMNLTALSAGIISSSFYYVYTTMQIPVGILFDKHPTRLLLAFNACIFSLGCLCFAHSHSIFTLITSRIIIGAGASFAFVGLSHLLREHYPLKRFGFMIGLSETLGFFVAMFGMIGLGNLISILGWRNIITLLGICGFGIAFLCFKFIPKHDPLSFSPPNQTFKETIRQLLLILKSRPAWMNGLFVGLSFMVITVFGGMWAIPFIQAKTGCGLKVASVIDAMIFLGSAASCPLFATLANYFTKRRPLMVVSCLLTAILVFITLYAPIQHYFVLGLLMFLTGLSCGAYMLAYSVSNELAPKNSLSTCTGFTNTLAMITAPLLQPLVGCILDYYEHINPLDILGAYQKALLIVPGSLCLAATLVLGLPEKNNNAD